MSTCFAGWAALNPGTKLAIGTHTKDASIAGRVDIAGSRSPRLKERKHGTGMVQATSLGTANGHVFKGNLETLAISATVTLQPNDDKEKEIHTDFLVLHGRNEIGVARERSDDQEITSPSLSRTQPGTRFLHAGPNPVTRRATRSSTRSRASRRETRNRSLLFIYSLIT